MSVKIRLARHGRKQHAYYHIVVANSRAPRDGRFIERIGSYNPNTNPATIDLDFEKAISWLFKGAQPTDTTRSILSHEGVLMKKHLLDGAKKGAFSEADAELKFEAWKKEKESKIQASKDKLNSTQLEEKKARLKAESKVNESRLAEIAKRNAAVAAAKAPAPAPAPAEEISVVEESVPVAEESAPVAEETAPETEETAPVAEETTPVAEVETSEESSEA
jgi:small subunit ribosomal protein S16